MNDLPCNVLNPPIALTIAGSDSGGGAGIQADLKVFAFHQVHGASAITCVTAQNTTGVSRVDALSPEAVVAQASFVCDDMHVKAIKTGMLLNEQIIESVARFLLERQIRNVVVDPVMVSRSGDLLIEDAAIKALTSKLLPLATILTPNVHEATLLSGVKIDSIEDMKKAAIQIHKAGCQAVLVKGGGLKEAANGTDVWFDGDSIRLLRSGYIQTIHTHGTGCTLSAAIAANLASGQAPFAAVEEAKKFVFEALRYPLEIGAGTGPPAHFFRLMQNQHEP